MRIFKVSSRGVYKTSHFKRPYKIIISLIYKLYGKKYAKYFKDSWVPLIFYIDSHGTIFNWGIILLANLNIAIKRSRDLEYNSSFEFFMSSYILDATCVRKHFPRMTWTWLRGEPPFHVTANSFGIIRTRTNITRFVTPLSTIFLCGPPPCMLEQDREVITSIGD